MSNEEKKNEELIEKLVSVKIHSKTVKGGRIMSFAALTGVGDGKGRSGVCRGKSREVPADIQKAMENA
ncbi:30S ribosomal protein S5, partial [Francisella tularensis subsp. holarctica]|nr:30S ribosomal protein S5 [Francisella tularensis subsp. holarctica]